MVVVAGRFDETKTLGVVEKYFGAIPQPERSLSQPTRRSRRRMASAK